MADKKIESERTPETGTAGEAFPAQVKLEQDIAEVKRTLASTVQKSPEQIAAERKALEDEARVKADALSVGGEESKKMVFENLFAEATAKFDQEAKAALAQQARAARLESDLVQLKDLRSYLEA
ncbi:hypothetical protein KJ910_04555 [Patescibacteria group bacterium]|nr:hypothetical protein [Patescibacteria group bacterium]MBU1906799.1 hypothetical protein [Patescibacteria group bacterium]